MTSKESNWLADVERTARSVKRQNQCGANRAVELDADEVLKLVAGYRRQDEMSEVPTGPVAGTAEHRFMLWLMKEIPAGTVISSPSWWSPRIFRAVQRAMEIHAEKATEQCPRCSERQGPTCNYCGREFL